MGILSLNTFLRENCRNIDNIVHFSQLKYKKICVDVYNYIYRFLAKDKLIEDLEKLCKIFQKYNYPLEFHPHLSLYRSIR